MKDDVMLKSSALKEIVIYTFITVHLLQNLFKTYSALHYKILLCLPPLLCLHLKVLIINILDKNNREFSFEMFNLSHGNGGCRRYFELTAQNVRLE